jgi:hypothetical protein
VRKDVSRKEKGKETKRAGAKKMEAEPTMGLTVPVVALTEELAELMRWREVEWEGIPPDSRERVVTFLSVQDNLLGLNVALTIKKKKDKRDLRDELIKSYRDTVIPAFHSYPFTDGNDFQDLRRVLKMGIDLQGLTLSLQANAEKGWAEVTEPNKVLWHLVEREIPFFAELMAEKSQAVNAKYVLDGDAGLVSTLDRASKRGYSSVARILIEKGADLNGTRDNGTTPLYLASQEGHFDVARLLVEAGAAIDRRPQMMGPPRCSWPRRRAISMW